VNADGQVAFVVPAFEVETVRGLPSGSAVITWEEDQDPYGAVAAAARDLGVSSGSILLDGYTWIDTQERLAGSMNGARIMRDPGVIESVRICKSPAEVEAIRAACVDTGRIYSVVDELLCPGLSELELAGAAHERLRAAGIHPWGDLIQGGESASVPHQRAGQRRFREGDAVIVDFVAMRQGYLGDMTRTFALGDVSVEIQRAYATVRSAQQAAIELARPGVTCEALDAAARGVIEAAGLGPYFLHRLGHGIGLDVHEPPYLVRGNRMPLAPGMCVTIEPGVYVAGQFGIRIEDVIVITEDGAEVLSRDVPTDVSPQFAGDAPRRLQAGAA
jgi:Xaa-Pro aminopeptidase